MLKEYPTIQHLEFTSILRTQSMTGYTVHDFVLLILGIPVHCIMGMLLTVGLTNVNELQHFWCSNRDLILYHI